MKILNYLEIRWIDALSGMNTARRFDPSDAFEALDCYDRQKQSRDASHVRFIHLTERDIETTPTNTVAALSNIAFA